MHAVALEQNVTTREFRETNKTRPFLACGEKNLQNLLVTVVREEEVEKQQFLVQGCHDICLAVS